MGDRGKLIHGKAERFGVIMLIMIYTAAGTGAAYDGAWFGAIVMWAVALWLAWLVL